MVEIEAMPSNLQLHLPSLASSLSHSMLSAPFSQTFFVAVEVKECTKRDGSGGERLNKRAVSLSSLGWPSASEHHAAVLVHKTRSSSSRCELALCRFGEEGCSAAIAAYVCSLSWLQSV